MKHFGDITKLHGYDLPVVDVITGGSPCQDLSVAGKRAGMKHADMGDEETTRSGLFIDQMRIVKEMRERDRKLGRTAWAVRPRYMVWENVPGAFSSGNPKGSDFAAVIEEIVKVCEPGAVVSVPVPDGGWTKSGCYYAEDGSWSIAWRVHDAQLWGVPQRRKRIALVADFGGLTAPEILFERKGLSGDTEPGGTAREETAGAAGGGVESASIGVDVYNQEITGGVAASLTAAVGGTNTSGAKILCLKPAVCAGFSFGQSEKARSIGYQKEVSPTLRGGGGGNQIPCVAQSAEPIPINTMVGTRDTEETRTTFGIGEPGDPQFTISAAHEHAVFDARGNGQDAYNDMLIAHSLKAKANCDFREDSETYPIQNSVVRRLTPLECERLQGFPDGWTDIGEWTDSKGKKHKEADSPRYKALGNSIALPFWQFLARRICAQYERQITMASLFDGIGGFPLAFSAAGALPVWASEIEEFPIAVTKYHFPEKEECECPGSMRP